MLDSRFKSLARIAALACCLGIGFLGGGIVSGLMNGRSASAESPVFCEDDICVLGRFCEDLPDSETGCNLVGQACESYACGRT